jgi:outer membrane lipoprotein SlyB
MWRVDGTVQSVAGTMVTVRTDDGQSQVVDMRELNPTTLRSLRPGERVSLFGTPRTDRRLVANGFLQVEGASPAASPRTQ